MSDGRVVIDSIFDGKPAEKGISDLQKSLNQAAAKAKAVGENMTKYLTLPLVAFGTAAFVAALDLDKAYGNIRAGTGATGKDLENLKKSFKNVFRDVPESADEVSRALADLNTRTGQLGKPLEELTKQFLELGRVTGEDIPALIRNGTRVFGDWGIEVEKQSSTMDYFWKVSQTTGISVNELMTKMVQFGAPLRQMGFDFETSAALMGKWEKEGVNAELVLGSLRIGLTKMAREGITDTNAALLEMITRIKEAGSTGEANRLAMEMFGAKAGPDMAAAIREGRFELEDLLTTLGQSDETIGKAAEDTKNFGQKMGELKNKAQIGLEPVGRILIDLAEKWLPPTIEMINKLAGWFENLSPVAQTTVVVLGLLLAGLGPLILFVGMLISLFSGLATVAAAVGIGVLPLIGIIAGVIAAIAAIIAIGVLLWKNWDTIKAKASDLGKAIRAKFQEMFNSVKEKMSNIKNSIQNLWGQAKTFLTSINLFEIGKNIIQGLLNGISNMASAVKNKAKEIASSVKDTIKGALKIFSPSRVMEDEVGEPVGQGVVVGMDNTEDDIIKKANSMAMAAIPDIKGIRSSNVESSNSLTGGFDYNKLASTLSTALGSPSKPAIIELHVGGKRFLRAFIEDINQLQGDAIIAKEILGSGVG